MSNDVSRATNDEPELVRALRSKAAMLPENDMVLRGVLRMAADRLATLESRIVPSAAREFSGEAPTVAEIEEFRRENLIEAHVGETPEAGLEPWAVQSNRVLNYLCYRACTPSSATTGGTRADIIEECAKLLDAEAAACQPGSPAEGQNWPLAIQSCAAKVRKLKGETHG